MESQANFIDFALVVCCVSSLTDKNRFLAACRVLLLLVYKMLMFSINQAWIIEDLYTFTICVQYCQSMLSDEYVSPLWSHNIICDLPLLYTTWDGGLERPARLTVKDKTSVLLISLLLAYSKALFQTEQLLPPGRAQFELEGVTAGRPRRCRETGWWLTNVSRLWNLGSRVRWHCPLCSEEGLPGGLVMLACFSFLSPLFPHPSSLALQAQGCRFFSLLWKGSPGMLCIVKPLEELKDNS